MSLLLFLLRLDHYNVVVGSRFPCCGIHLAVDCYYLYTYYTRYYSSRPTQECSSFVVVGVPIQSPNHSVVVTFCVPLQTWMSMHRPVVTNHNNIADDSVDVVVAVDVDFVVVETTPAVDSVM